MTSVAKLKFGDSLYYNHLLTFYEDDMLPFFLRLSLQFFYNLWISCNDRGLDKQTDTSGGGLTDTSTSGHRVRDRPIDRPADCQKARNLYIVRRSAGPGGGHHDGLCPLYPHPGRHLLRSAGGAQENPPLPTKVTIEVGIFLLKPTVEI